MSQKLPETLKQKMVNLQSFTKKKRQHNSYRLVIQIDNMDELPVCFDIPISKTVNRRENENIVLTIFYKYNGGLFGVKSSAGEGIYSFNSKSNV